MVRNCGLMLAMPVDLHSDGGDVGISLLSSNKLDGSERLVGLSSKT